MWKTERKADSYTGTNTAQTLPELLDELESQELITSEEKAKIEKTGHVVIGSKDISFAEGLTESSYTITSSLDEVNFNKIITEGDIAIEKPGFTNYTIEGISTSKEGEYLTSGSVTGKSGNLEIIGAINDATFKYTLTNFMQGDEVFYCKVNIDGEEHYKEIKVVQGDVVTYEEDFTGITYTGDAWEDDFNENYTNGKAKQTDSTNSSKGIEFQYLGKGCEVISRVNEDTGYIRISENDMILKYREVDSNGEELFQANITREVLENLEYGTHKIQILQAKSAETPWGNMFYIDAIKIYK